MFTFAYPAVFSRDEDGRWLVGFPDFPAAHTDGTDAIEAMEEAIDCLGSSIAFAMADKADVPKPSRVKRGQKLVPVPLWIVAKLALYWAIRDLGISQSELARRLGVRETIVRRMLDPNHDTRPEKIQAALVALGKRVVMACDDAA
ncbi:MAG TPA: type II toxin-antitoxin system HicB family antitoxin [Bryobacteraceae bacterium]|nr:type II toxin-antitoxin system HicB family antitoxin [Bryobacteraceae bacterium]